MKPSDLRRLERVIALADRLIDALDDARMRGVVGDWLNNGRRLRDDLAEFHDWQARRLETERSPKSDAS